MPEILARHEEEWKTLTDAATVSVDPADGHRFYHSGSSARTFAAPGTGGYKGQQLVIAMKNTGGSGITHTFTTGSAGAWRFGADITGISELASGTTDYVTAVYHDTDQRWDIVGYSKGY